MILKLCQEVQEIIKTPIVYWALIAGPRTSDDIIERLSLNKISKLNWDESILQIRVCFFHIRVN